MVIAAQGVSGQRCNVEVSERSVVADGRHL